MGVLSPARPPALSLIDMSGNFLALVSAESPSNISPNPSEVISEISVHGSLTTTNLLFLKSKRLIVIG